MGYTFGKRSSENRDTCDPEIIKLLDAAIITAPFDFSVIHGYRGEVVQNNAFNNGNSRVKYPNSLHNKKPSRAVDLAPYPIDWEDVEKFNILACHIKVTAYKLGIPIIWGPDLGGWMTRDLGHYQLRK